jgi:BCD family chlorophyll transporter-like MFS transporter
MPCHGADLMTSGAFTFVRFFAIVRLGLFTIGYGSTGALMGGTLNRVMIAELGFAASLVGLFFAAPLIDAPLRIWLGHRSDAYPILGRRREPYVVIGSLLAGIGVLAAIRLALLGPGGIGRTAGIMAAFVLYGFGRNLSHNTFQALLADTFTGPSRPRAMTGYEVATLIGLIAGSGIMGRVLGSFDPARLFLVCAVAVAAAFLLALAAVAGQERPSAETEEAARRARGASFGEIIRSVVAGDPQIRLIFTVVFLTMVGTLAQDILLEPFGGLVLGMTVGQTTQLTAFWGIGVLVSMLLAGNLLIPRFGAMPTLRCGLAATVAIFVAVIGAGASGSPGAFRGMVGIMGLGTGIAGAGLLTLIISSTTSVRAGLLLGVWGFANLLGKAFGGLLGGAVVDVVQRLAGGSALTAYSLVFALEAVMLAAAFVLSFRIDFARSRAAAG